MGNPSTIYLQVWTTQSKRMKINHVQEESLIIVNRGKWLRSQVNIKEANRQAEIYLGRSLTLHIVVLYSLNELHNRNKFVV